MRQISSKNCHICQFIYRKNGINLLTMAIFPLGIFLGISANNYRKSFFTWPQTHPDAHPHHPPPNTHRYHYPHHDPHHDLHHDSHHDPQWPLLNWLCGASNRDGLDLCGDLSNPLSGSCQTPEVPRHRRLPSPSRQVPSRLKMRPDWQILLIKNVLKSKCRKLSHPAGEDHLQRRLAEFLSIQPRSAKQLHSRWIINSRKWKLKKRNLE